MDEILRKRIERKLDGLPEDKGYQVLDYIEFLESKYGTTARQPTPVERITEGVGDAMRAARVPAQAIRGTMGAVDSAGRMVERLAAAGRAAVEELKRGTSAPPPPEAPPAAEGASSAEPVEPVEPGGPA
jgi:hypothetical protein